MNTKPAEVDHGKAIDEFYRRKREASQREHAKMMQMINDGASRAEIMRQEEIYLAAGDCGD